MLKYLKYVLIILIKCAIMIIQGFTDISRKNLTTWKHNNPIKQCCATKLRFVALKLIYYRPFRALINKIIIF
jgi:hypothetical protein